jgi:hypothetical protein
MGVVEIILIFVLSPYLRLSPYPLSYTQLKGAAFAKNANATPLLIAGGR